MIKNIFKFFSILIKIAILFIVFLMLLGGWTTNDFSAFIPFIIILVIIYFIYCIIKKAVNRIILRIRGFKESSPHNDLDELDQIDSADDVVDEPEKNLSLKTGEENTIAEEEPEVPQQIPQKAVLTSPVAEKELPEPQINIDETSLDPTTYPISPIVQETSTIPKIDIKPKIPKHISIVDADSLLVKAGCLIVKDNKASIGSIQRKFKIGFNRAAHIMDQLAEIGLVGPENDTRPRTILMTEEEFFEQLDHIDYIESENIPPAQSIIDEIIKNESPDPLMSKIEVEYIINDKTDYSKNGESLFNLQNSIIPCVTDSDKTAVINTLIKFNSCDKLKLIMIDRTGVDFLQYHLLPHLFIPIVTDDTKIQNVVDWAYAEMQGRIEKFLPLYARDIFSYNTKVATNSRLPIVTIIVGEIFGLNTESFSHFTELLLNSMRMGICFIGFSKMEYKSLSLGVNQKLFETKSVSQFLDILMDVHSPDKKYSNFDDMDGVEFERYCADLLRKNNFHNVEITKDSGDQGIDILAQKDGIQYGIQCKCYSSDIGNKAVQEAFAGKTYYGCHVAVVLTNRHFTKSAKELATTNKVILWDREKLENLIASAKT